MLTFLVFCEGQALLLEEFLDHVPDPDKDHGTDDGAHDLAVPLGPEGAVCADEAQQPAAYYTAQKAAMAPKSRVRMMFMVLVFSDLTQI